MGRFRRALAAALALALLALAGCGVLFDTEYASSEPYQAPAAQEEPAPAAAYDGISDYAALRRAVLQLVTDHVESAQLQFTGYDGVISDDISAACWEVKSSTAIGAFAVDYISYDLSRIVSYYQAEIHITYKRSAAQAAAVEQTATVSALEERLDRALRQDETYLVLQIADASASADTIRACIESAYYADPLAAPVLPAVEVALFPETGVSRIAEVTLDYGLAAQDLAQRRADLTGALEALAGEVSLPETADGPARAEALYGLCQALADRCQADSAAGPTAWDALAGGAADSQGIALALEAGCQSLGFPCQVVSGRMDGEAHYWDIVTLDGACYHIDASVREDGAPAVFLAGDGQLWGAYWWDTSQYPVCPEPFGPPEPTPSPSPLPTATPRPVYI